MVFGGAQQRRCAGVSGRIQSELSITFNAAAQLSSAPDWGLNPIQFQLFSSLFALDKGLVPKIPGFSPRSMD
jgi:hypothetical protein